MEWVEFKKNNSNPEEIGRYISALANSAALNRKTNAYLLWGIQDKTHDIIGTSFNPETAKNGNEPLENWLLRLLSPNRDSILEYLAEDELIRKNRRRKNRDYQPGRADSRHPTFRRHSTEIKK